MTSKKTPDRFLADGKYELGSIIGEGGMAVVYRATNTALDAEVAIKMLLPNLSHRPMIRERFVREAKAMARLRHHHIVSVYDVFGNGDGGDKQFIVMEFITGGSLLNRIHQRGSLGQKWSASVCIAVLRALSLAHGRGMVHRDIKPANILFTEDGAVKVTDFGIVQMELEDTGLTKIGTPMGTFGFMSPEQKSDGSSVDLRSDIFAVGATLYCMLVGVEVPPDLQSCELDLDMLNSVPEVFRGLIEQATKYNRKDRFQSAQEMIDALRAIYDELPDDPPEPEVVVEPESEPDEALASVPEAVEAEPQSVVPPGGTMVPEELEVPEERYGHAVSGDQDLDGLRSAGTTFDPGGHTVLPGDSLSDDVPTPRRSRWPIPVAIIGLVVLLCVAGMVLFGDGDATPEATASEPVVELAGMSDPEPIVVPEPEPEVQIETHGPSPEAAKVVELEALVQIEPEVVIEPEPEVVPVPDPIEPDSVAKAPEPEPVIEIPEPEVLIEPEVTVEPEPEAMVAAPEPEPTIEPGIQHVPVSSLTIGQDFMVKARVHPEGSYKVVVYYRPTNSGAYKSKPLATRGGAYQATISWDDTFSNGIDYRITATPQDPGGSKFSSGSGPRPHRVNVQ